ncbi:carboxymuconolactone decarboxylase family protein [Amycolatopsis jiangsuensis]|uniref:AhpD family alkylhydroperoxidase n=1 Tax=Amycolatopsis jiangsuensis TaxID=1181879 RepID=A0A840ISL5_9PSEU|nr:carboxymuconolactone decarboxylase family protein [Amycolatopsis jiangsuensis]MBB4685611.1 AhpD family alkylhydroperoxidase [Amycolatopsis jiangsuensis]
MTKRIALAQGGLYRAMAALQAEVGKAAADAGLDARLTELVKMRASQLNGCAFCLDMHAAEAVAAGESPRRLYVLEGWRETALFTEQERAALAYTEAMTVISEHKDVPEDVYAEATRVFTEDQYRALAWSVVAINSWNRLMVTSHAPLPERVA